MRSEFKSDNDQDTRLNKMLVIELAACNDGKVRRRLRDSVVLPVLIVADSDTNFYDIFFFFAYRELIVLGVFSVVPWVPMNCPFLFSCGEEHN